MDGRFTINASITNKDLQRRSILTAVAWLWPRYPIKTRKSHEIRKLSIAEIKVFASYPEAFQLVGSPQASGPRVGSSVPPLLMKVIAERIRHRFFMNKPTAW